MQTTSRRSKGEEGSDFLFDENKQMELISGRSSRKVSSASSQSVAQEMTTDQSESNIEPLSYRLDLWNQINFIGSRIKKGGVQMGYVSTFLKSVRKNIDNFTLALRKALSQLRKDLQKDGDSTESLHQGLLYFTDSFEDLCDDIQKQLATHLTSEIIEPLDLFHSHFNQTNSNFYSDAYSYTTELIEQKRKLIQLKDKYMKSSKSASETAALIERALLEHQQGKIKIDEVQKITDKSLQLKFKAELTCEAYKKQIDATNEVWAKFNQAIGPSLDAMHQSEQSRIQFLKFTLEKVLRCNEMLCASLLDRTSQLQVKVQLVDALSDIQNYIKLKRKSDVRTRKKKEEFKPYEVKAPDLSRPPSQSGSFIAQGPGTLDQSFLFVNDDHRQTVDINKPQQQKQLLKKVFNSLVYEDTPSSEDQVINGTKMLCESRNRIFFAELIGSINSARQMPNEVKLRSFSEMVLNLLNSKLQNDDLVLNQDMDSRPIYWILSSTQNFFTFRQESPKTPVKQKEESPDAKEVKTEELKPKEEEVNKEEEVKSAKLKPSPKRASAYLTFAKNRPKKRRVYLTHFLRDHGIWQESYRWETWIQSVLEQKLQEHDYNTELRLKRKAEEKFRHSQTSSDLLDNSIESRKHSSSLNNSFSLGETKKKDKSFFGGMASGFRKIFGAKEKIAPIQGVRLEDDIHYESGRKNIIFNVLSNFVYYLSILQMPLNFSKRIILHLSQSYELNPERVHLLVTELESNQRAQIESKAKTPHELATISLNRRSKERRKWCAGIKEKAYIFPLGIALQFVNDPHTLLSYLTLNKELHQLFKDKVYEQLLSRVQLSMNQRKFLWLSALDTQKVKVEYEALKEKIKERTIFIKNVEQVINMDVQRSFNHYDQIKPATLLGILQTYAFYNPEVEYCQGMNFIAGLLYLLFGKEEQAFKVLVRIIDKYDMVNMFNEDLPQIKVYFYQFDRLISMFLPELHAHFKDQNINASYYSSVWFITLHSNILQYHPDTENLPVMLVALWDQFILHGWKIIFKFSLYMLSEMQEDLIELKFEKLLNAVNEVGRTAFFRDVDRAKRLPEELKHFKVTNSLLRRLEQEFKLSQLRESEVGNGNYAF